MREAVDRFDSLPSPACSHSDSTSRIDSPRTNAPITIARSGSVRSTLGPLRKELGGERLGRRSHLRNLHAELSLRGLHPARAKAVAQSRRRLRPALIACAAQPRIELVLDSPLDDQLAAELRQLRQRLARILADPDGEQPVDLRL